MAPDRHPDEVLEPRLEGARAIRTARKIQATGEILLFASPLGRPLHLPVTTRVRNETKGTENIGDKKTGKKGNKNRILCYYLYVPPPRTRTVTVLDRRHYGARCSRPLHRKIQRIRYRYTNHHHYFYDNNNNNIIATVPHG